MPPASVTAVAAATVSAFRCSSYLLWLYGWSSRGHAQDELAAGTAGLTARVGPGGLLQREDLLDLHPYRAGVDELTDAGQGRAVGLDQEDAGTQSPRLSSRQQVG